MRKLHAWLGAATLVILWSAFAHASPNALKPYIVLVLDTSGSMQQATNSGPPSCADANGNPLADTKLNHARCAINDIANSYGDMVFGLGRFRNVMSGTTTAATFPTGCCSPGPGVGAGGGCPAGIACATPADNQFELLTPLIDGTNASTAAWTNFTGNTCTATGTDPEIWNADSSTPLEGALRGVKDYWLGTQETALTISASPNGATEAGTTATFKTTAAHGFAVGEQVVVGGVAVAGYNGTWTVASVPTGTTFTATIATSGLAASGAGTAAPLVWPSGAPGFSPIVNDSLNGVFLSPAGDTSCNPNPTTCSNAGNCNTTSNCCCTSQCRPYIVILLTDGDETCGGTPANAAAALLTTDIGAGAGAKRYRVITDPIGFGTAVPYAPMESIAHSGGHTDVPGVNEAFYANDQAGLELAISSIIEGSVRTELCNGLDDDCDGEIDEDFPTKGNACTNGLEGACAVSGTLQCRADGTGLVCNAGTAPCNGQPDGHACSVVDTGGSTVAGTCLAGVCNPTPGVEICNGLDDDCDGIVDEGLTSCNCTPTGESCNNKDDDCDGKIDEDLTQACGTGACLGTETCSAGVWVGCTARVPTTEICNGIDDDCDGVIDGFTVACSNMVTPGGPATDNPGDPPNNPIPQNLCHPGSKTCPVGGTGVFSTCTGEVVPTTEICNGLDDDCDNVIDEDFVPQDCSTNCGIGQTECVGGTIMCTSTPATSDATCNNVDDDCDGSIDEDWACGDPSSVPFVPCACGAGSVCDGQAKCVNGAVVCAGGPVNTESCNCVDDDCDGTVDEDAACPGGSSCVDCQCAFPCNGGEFPCPLGKVCTNGFCEIDLCYGHACPNGTDGTLNECIVQGMTPTCVSVCSQTTCDPGFACTPSTGVCDVDNCTNFPSMCTADQNCIGGTCVTNPCKGVMCPTDQYCEAGNCIASCADITCPTGQRCRLGACQTDPCGMPCPAGEVCHDNTGQCGENPCDMIKCPQAGQWCNPNDGMCEDDPCVGTSCPTADQICRGGTCYGPGEFAPDAGVGSHVTVGGGGGCNTSGGNASWLVALAAIAALRRRRRSAGGRS